MKEGLCPIIDRLPVPQRRQLVDRAVPRRLVKGESLFLTGEKATCVYVVERGALKLSLSDAEGSETILGLAVTGDLVGEVAALDHSGHPHNAVAVTKSGVIALDAALFVDLVTAHQPAALELARHLCTRERNLTNVLFERTVGHGPVRLAGRLLSLSESLGRMSGETIELQLPLAQEELGRLAGMCRESTCKTLMRFRRAGVVDYRGRTLRILRPDVLERLRCGARVAAPSR